MVDIILKLGRRAMGCEFEFTLIGNNEIHLRAAAEEALSEVDRLEDQMSLFLPTSELCHINARAAKEKITVEPRLFALLQQADQLHHQTDGTFDIAMAPLMDALGFLGGPGRDPRSAHRCSGMKFVEFGDQTVHFQRKGVALDLGGIGKGFALDRAADILHNHGIQAAFLHAGSSTIYALGAPPNELGWKIGLVDPRDPEQRLGTLSLRDQAFSTSSSLGKVVQKGKKTIGHVIDPHSGKPVRRTSAWALCPTATEADALSTAFLILDVEQVRKYVDLHPPVAAIVLDRKLRSFGVEPSEKTEPRQAGNFSRRAFLKGSAAAAAAFSVGFPGRTLRAQDAQPKEEVTVAMIGCGEHGMVLLSQLVRLPGVTIKAVCDTQESKSAAALKIAGRNVESYDDFEYLLEEEDVHAVVIATPTHTHGKIAMAALKEGRHVFCEAPMVHSIDDGKKMVEASKASQKIVQVGHQRRTSKLYPHAQTHIKSGAIGRILQLRAQWNHKTSWRKALSDPKLENVINWRLYKKTSGGLPLEYGSHILDLANWYLDSVPEAVTGFGAILKWKDGREVEDSVQLLFRYPGGIQLNFGSSLINSYGYENEIVIGDAASILLSSQQKGMLFKESDTTAAGWEAYAKTEMLGKWRGIILDAEATKYKKHLEGEMLGPDADKADSYAELEQFVESVRSGKAPVCDARAGLRAAVPAILAAEALAKESVIKITKEHYEV